MTIKPKVAIITPGSFPIPSKRSSSVETVIEKLTHVLQDKIDFTIFGKSSKKLPNRESRGNINYIRISRRSWSSYAHKIARELQLRKHDVIQVENRPKFVPIIRQYVKDTKIILSLHSITYISTSHIPKTDLNNCLEKADFILVNSHFLKDFLIHHTTFPSEKILVNHLGVDTNRFCSKWINQESKMVISLKKQHKLEGKNILLYVGRLRKIKGVHKILRLFPKIRDLVPGTVLIIAGSAYIGSEKKTGYVESLHQLASDLGDDVRFMSFIPHDQIHSWFAAADVVLVPSIGKEAFGLVNVEAMACGVPVIATNIGGIPEIIEHGKTGYLVSTETMETEIIHYVNKLLSNPEWLKEMGENCVQHVKNRFTWEKSGEHIFTIYTRDIL
ncbi:glycosyltransferase family 4 protein [Neobacillus sp. LXY-1]|uniref:glycosyltransferase family 4 protein n=1 Tax=Neobacillus sp. LXY-1 TaxID=3379133 RepID=UPI003EDF12FB